MRFRGLDEEDVDMEAGSEYRAASTPKADKTRECWDSSDLDKTTGTTGTAGSSRSKNPKEVKGQLSGRGKRRASVAQRRRRAREKQQSILRQGAEGEGEEDDASEMDESGAVSEPRPQTQPQDAQGVASPADDDVFADAETGPPGQPTVQERPDRTQEGPEQGPATLPTATGPGPSLLCTFTGDDIKAISQDVYVRSAGGSGEQLEHPEIAFNAVDMDYERIDNCSIVSVNETKTLDVRDLVTSSIDTGNNKVVVKDVIAYVVLKFDPRTDKNWTVPEPTLFHDLMNRVDSRIQEKLLPCARAYRWANLWGRVGLLGLSPSRVDLLNEYRHVIESQKLGPIKFTIFPKEALEKKGNLSILLRENFRAYKVECLPRAILTNTRSLKGGLKVTHWKSYPDTARSRAGASKRGWRLVLLQGCPELMDSIKKFDVDYKFSVGSGHVIIRGGVGRPRTSTSNRAGRGAWGQYGNGNTTNRARHPSHSNKSYDRRFPDPKNISAVGRGRGRGAAPSEGINPGWTTAGESRDRGPVGATDCPR